ncbi:MAG TPA: YMGG-like glycine zipper-containing protein, partial [Pyrinomonadaceae bacterium]|nr:YMGG-like glycine zipper-containing protein [Pyrinomonadaceae bacterium]
LNRSRSDNVANIVNTSIRNFPSNRRDTVRQNLERRLASPEMIAIRANGREIEMATSNSRRVSFTADGIGRSETNPRGRNVTTTTSLSGDILQVNYTGDRVNDFFVTFDPSGDQLIVTKRIYIENRNETVTVRSFYDRVNPSPDWTAVNAGPVWSGGQTGVLDFYVPNGTRLNASLSSPVNTRGSQVGDRFTMVVNSPAQYRGAVIGGHVGEARNSGRFTGRANLSMELDTISINGRTYRFAGIIDSVNPLNGDSITVDNEGSIRDTGQTRETVTRAGVGALLGAIIGAIAGGGEGAAIGAGVGAGVGAGSVLVTGRENIDLGVGSTFTITATAPVNNRIGAN